MEIRKVTGEVISTGLIEVINEMHRIQEDYKAKRITMEEARMYLGLQKQIIQAVALDWAFNKENIAEKLKRVLPPNDPRVKA